MNQDYTPLGPSTPSIEEQQAASGGSFPWSKTLIVGCGGCAVIFALAAIFGGWAVMKFGLGVFTDEVENDLRTNPVVLEHIGRIEDFDLDFGASIATEGEDDFVFRVSGTKGSGRISATCVTTSEGVEKVVAGTIQLESGETLDLFPEDEEVINEAEIVEESE
jgi:hypothetical protein